MSNSGTLSADGGRVELTAATARAVVDSVINNKGVIEANSIGTRSGRIVLSAATGASKPAGAPTQVVKLSGQISAAGKDKGTKGGTVVVTGEKIQLAGASINVSGDAGGGKVLIGGDTGGGHPSAAAANIELAKLESFVIPTATTVSVDAGTVINASAIGNGKGGKVVLWSDQQTTFAGTILARGGAGGGNGGFVETSSHGTLNFTGALVNTMAPAGKTGTWLLDPTDLDHRLDCRRDNFEQPGDQQRAAADVCQRPAQRTRQPEFRRRRRYRHRQWRDFELGLSQHPDAERIPTTSTFQSRQPRSPPTPAPAT